MANSLKTIRRGAILATVLLGASASLVMATVTISSVVRFDPFSPVRQVDLDTTNPGDITIPRPNRPPVRDPFRPPIRSPFIP